MLAVFLLDFSYPTSKKQEHKNYFKNLIQGLASWLTDSYARLGHEWVCGPLVIKACFGPKTQILSWTEPFRFRPVW